MRVWCVWAAFLLATVPVVAAPSLSANLSPNVRVTLDSEENIVLLVKPHEGDAWTRLARRVTGDAARWPHIAALNAMGENLTTHRAVKVPFSMAKPELQREVIRALFPADREDAAGWKHKVVAGGSLEGESLWKIAEWFTGDGANYVAIREANPKQALSTRRGEWILIPRAVLSAAFAPQSAEPEIAEDDPVEARGSEGEMERGSDKGIAAPSLPRSLAPSPPLEYERSSDRPYAIYRLRRDEAIYSSVVIRYTGRVFAKDVDDAVREVIEFNGIENVARLPVGYPVRIPMELLSPEHRPPDDPRRIEFERARLETTRRAHRLHARNLEGVHIIIDAGHGGRDVGTVQGDLWESAYVYDVACRLKKLLETKTRAKVHMTTRSRESGYEVAERNQLGKASDHVVLTTPRYILDNPVVGVNLRWYLANSILRKARRQGTRPEQVVFISLHADSLHASLRGAMAYIPGNRYVVGSYTKDQAVYLARDEVKESPTVRQTAEEALEAEGLSRAMAESVIESFSNSALQVHPFNPVRDNVVRGGREWVPAVIRYNKVPTRLLLEICNIGNEQDRALIQTRKFRQRVADAIVSGLVDHFVNRVVDDGVVAAR